MLNARIQAAAALLALAAAFAAPLPAQAGSGTDPKMPGEILVKLASGDALPRLLSRYPVTLVDRFGARPIYRLRVIGSASVKDVLDRMALNPDVMIAETNPLNRAPEARQNMPWAIGTASAWKVQWAPEALNLPEAQAVTKGAGIRVAVLDTGVDQTHPALATRLISGFDFVDFDADPSEFTDTASAAWGHGTHVAGLVALAAPAARIMPVRVLDAQGVGNAWVLGEALLWAVDPDGNPDTDDGAHVINLSLGSLARTRILGALANIAACNPAVDGDPVLDRSDPGYADDERRCAQRAGAVVVAAAGNDASDRVREYPAAERVYGSIGVGAINAAAETASFSNFGSRVDIGAPGDGITSTLPGGLYGTWSGTSMAAPLVAGTAALVRARSPGLTARGVVNRLRRGSVYLCDGKLTRLDAEAAVKNLQPPAPVCP